MDPHPQPNLPGPSENPQTQPPAAWNYDLAFDGGDKSCGELILELAHFFAPLPPETRVCVTARDEAAWIDIPAWCRVTGHGFLAEKPPYYLLQKKG